MDYRIPVKGWPAGVDNVQPDIDVTSGALRSALNVDIFDGGKLKLRNGFMRRAAVLGADSIWSHSDLAVGYYTAGGSVFQIDQNFTSVAVVTGLSPALPVAFCNVNGEVFWSNAAATGRILNGVNRPWGVSAPANVPTLTQTTGSMEPGVYQVSVTYRTASGEEGPATTPATITLTAVGGISVSNISVPVDTGVTLKNVYVSAQNGDVMYRADALPSAQTSVVMSAPPQQAVVMRSQNFSVMPPGGILAHRNGVVYSANGPYIFHSEPLRFGMCNRAKSFFAFPSDVTVMLAVPEGLYVVADKTYFLENPATDDVVQRVLLPFGAAANTGVYLPGGTEVAWFSHRGQVVASAGEAKVVTEAHYTPAIMLQGASVVREQQGIRQIITVARRVGDNSQLEFTGA